PTHTALMSLSCECSKQRDRQGWNVSTSPFRVHLETCQFSYPVYPCHVAEKGLVERLAVTPVMDNRPRRRFAQKAGAPGAFSTLVAHNCRGQYPGRRNRQDTCRRGGNKKPAGARLDSWGGESRLRRQDRTFSAHRARGSSRH